MRDSEFNKTFLSLQPELLVMKVGQETSTGLVMRMGNVIPRHRSFSCHLADSGHGADFLKTVNKEGGTIPVDRILIQPEPRL